MTRTDVHESAADSATEPDYQELALAIRSLIPEVKSAEAKYELSVLADHYESLARATTAWRREPG